MRLGGVPNALASENSIGQYGCHPVEEIVEDPVEHLDQEGKFLEEAAVDMLLEPGRVGGADHPQATTCSLFGLPSLDNVVLKVKQTQLRRRLAGWCVENRLVSAFGSAEYAIIAPPREEHATE